MPAEIVLRAAVIAVEIVVAAGVLVAAEDVVAGAVDVPEAAVEAVDATAAVVEDGTKLTSFCHGSSRIRRIERRIKRKGPRKWRSFLFAPEWRDISSRAEFCWGEIGSAGDS